MKPAEREQWILDYLAARASKVFNVTANREEIRHWPIDVLDAYFVDDFAEATGATLDYRIIGANVCPTLGRDLSRMYKAGKLTRWTSGVEGLSGQGFPKWVWSYSLPNKEAA